jgi:AcrR family transcriptional regulator
MNDVGRGSAGQHAQAGAATVDREAGSRAGTRQRIQSVALELFAEQGYDKTSLREIAERLGVTKAALYYHFKSKEDLVASLVEKYFIKIDTLIEWGRSQARTPKVRAEILDRYYQIMADAGEVYRMLQHNQASVNSLSHGKQREEFFRERIFAMVELLTEPGAPLPKQLRAGVALASVSYGCMFFAERAGGPAEIRDAVLDLAFELTGAQPGAPAGN